MNSPAGIRRRYVYAYDVWDIRTGTIRQEAYIGKSSWPLRFRDAQHRQGKPWAEHIVGDIYPLWSADCGRTRLWFTEVWFIVTHRPLFNVEWNRWNPARMPPWEARRLYALTG